MRSNPQTIRFLLNSLNLCDYNHVVVRTKKDGQPVPIGGGRVSYVVRNWGHMEVQESFITSEGILILIVK